MAETAPARPWYKSRTVMVVGAVLLTVGIGSALVQFVDKESSSAVPASTDGDVNSVADLDGSVSEPTPVDIVPIDEVSSAGEVSCDGTVDDIASLELTPEACELIQSTAFMLMLNEEDPDLVARIDRLDQWEESSISIQGTCEAFEDLPFSSMTNDRKDFVVSTIWEGLDVDVQTNIYDNEIESFARFLNAGMETFCPELA